MQVDYSIFINENFGHERFLAERIVSSLSRMPGKGPRRKVELLLVNFGAPHPDALDSDTLTALLEPECLGASWVDASTGLPLIASEAASGAELRLFVLVGAADPESWVTDSGEQPRRDNVQKEYAFYLRTLQSYRLGHFVKIEHGDRGTVAVGPSRTLREALQRLNRYIHNRLRVQGKDETERAHELAPQLAKLSKDVTVLRELWACEAARMLLPGDNAPPPFADEFERQTDGGNGTSINSNAHFLTCLATVYQLGRRSSAKATESIRAKIAWLKQGSSSYELDHQMLQCVLGDTAALGVGVPPEGPELSAAFGQTALRVRKTLRAYELLRDFSKWLAAGAFYWTEVHGKFARHGLKILIVDDDLNEQRQDDEKALRSRRLIEELNHISRAFTHRHSMVEFHVLSEPQRSTRDERGTSTGPISVDGRGSTKLPPTAGDVVEGLEQADAEIQIRRLSALGDRETSPETAKLCDYHVILVEIEYRQYESPQLVAKLAALFEQEQHQPAVIALSRSGNAGYIQQCLNRGAVAYVRKDRIYRLPALIANARISDRHLRRFEKGSNFRLIHALIPREIARLQGDGPRYLIRGELGDYDDRKWLRSMPKADLHYHIGTSIRAVTIEAMSLNSCGYLFDSQFESGLHREWQDTDWLGRLVEKICKVVILAQLEVSVAPATQVLSHASAVLRAARVVLSGYGPQGARFGLSDLESLVDTLFNAQLPIRRFEVASLFVAVVSRLAARIGSHIGLDRAQAHRSWGFLEALQGWEHRRPSMSKLNPLAEFMQLCSSISRKWTYAATTNQIERTYEEQIFFEVQREVVEKRVRLATEGIDRALDAVRFNPEEPRGLLDPPDAIAFAREPLTWLMHEVRSEKLLTLEAIVRIPAVDGQNPQASPGHLEERTLLRYLWGASLLGADHLQYPENILAAAFDIVEQALDDNVWYSELRCATPGYCAGGMTVIDATDLLCTAFDVATMCFGKGYMKRESASAAPSNWVRINVLLGAKRHKSEDSLQETATLLSYYLNRREPASKRRRAEEPPSWWGRTRVVGFDLSGDESRDSQHAEKLMLPLFKLSAPITIHAGEAATADSIWEAVYKFRARRIGHGLRLRENRSLMEFCVREGICLEMCPISNEFTNWFRDSQRLSPDETHCSRAHYPLKWYMDQGLDVCINSDNRTLHGDANSLTDEYLRAAKMVGGLTKWEALKLIKAGFKHAFLPKEEVATMLRAVEHEIYRRLYLRPA